MPKDSSKWSEKYICGDMNTTLIKTVKGLTIKVQHDASTPRPYDRINLIQGTKGIFRDFPYTHQLWRRLGETARGAGHGGMDYIMAWRLVQCLRDGLPYDMDVYDGAAVSAPFPLSAQSVARGSAPVKIPDFTRGGWQQKRDTLM